MEFAKWLNEGSRWETSYHVTYLKNIDGIGESGLFARGGFSAWKKPHLVNNSAKGVFYCNDKECVHHWIDELAEQSY